MSINCPKCQYPNDDTATSCRTCAEPLADAAFSRALERATSGENRMSQGSGAMPSPISAPISGGEPLSPSPVGNRRVPAQGPPLTASTGDAGVFPPTDLSSGLAPPFGAPRAGDIESYVEQEKSRKRMRVIRNVVLLLLVAGGVTFYFLHSSRKKAKLEQVVSFGKAFNRIDEGPVASFWRCAVRARHIDVHRSTDNRDLINRLEVAFKTFPTSQPDLLRTKCLPLLDQALSDLGSLAPPDDGFHAPISELKKKIAAVKSIFTSYIDKLDKRKDVAKNEQDVIKANNAFHSQETKNMDLSSAYVNFLLCLIPELPTEAKKIKKAPDSQPVVDLIYQNCKKDPNWADEMRKKCHAQLKETARAKAFGLIHQKLAGDARDVQSIEYCFKKVNRGFFNEDLNAIGKAFVEARNANAPVKEQYKKYKEGE
jgi:hypothetical protein